LIGLPMCSKATWGFGRAAWAHASDIAKCNNRYLIVVWN
jgi:hypothetical protein